VWSPEVGRIENPILFKLFVKYSFTFTGPSELALYYGLRAFIESIQSETMHDPTARARDMRLLASFLQENKLARVHNRVRLANSHTICLGEQNQWSIQCRTITNLDALDEFARWLYLESGVYPIFMRTTSLEAPLHRRATELYVYNIESIMMVDVSRWLNGRFQKVSLMPYSRTAPPIFAHPLSVRPTLDFQNVSVLHIAELFLNSYNIVNAYDINQLYLMKAIDIEADLEVDAHGMQRTTFPLSPVNCPLKLFPNVHTVYSDRTYSFYVWMLCIIAIPSLVDLPNFQMDESSLIEYNNERDTRARRLQNSGHQLLARMMQQPITWTARFAEIIRLRGQEEVDSSDDDMSVAQAFHFFALALAKLGVFDRSLTAFEYPSSTGSFYSATPPNAGELPAVDPAALESVLFSTRYTLTGRNDFEDM
jgi:hypothetical protein